MKREGEIPVIQFDSPAIVSPGAEKSPRNIGDILGGFLGSVPGISGGAILGDGRVGLILDAAGVVKLADQEGCGAPVHRSATAHEGREEGVISCPSQ